MEDTAVLDLYSHTATIGHVYAAGARPRGYAVPSSPQSPPPLTSHIVTSLLMGHLNAHQIWAAISSASHSCLVETFSPY